MRILDRYVLRDQLVTFAVGVGTLSLVILIHRIMLLVDLIVSKGVGLLVVLLLFLHSVPLSLVITVPLSALLAGITVYGRMAVENEVVALKTAGVNPLRLQAPALALGLAAALLTLFVSLVALPHSHRAFREQVFQMTRERVLASLQEGTFNIDFAGLTLYFGRMGADGSLRDVFVEDRREASERRLILAGEGRIAFDPDDLRMELALQRGTIHIAPQDFPDRYRLLSFRNYEMRIHSGGRLAQAAGRARDRKELTVAELRGEAAGLRQQGRGDARPLVEMHRRFAVPVSSLFFAFIGSALGLRMGRAGRWAGLLAGVVIGLGYYGLLAGGEDMGSQGYLSPAWAMWLPNAVLAATAGALALLGPREARARRRLAPAPAKPQPAS